MPATAPAPLGARNAKQLELLRYIKKAKTGRTFLQIEELLEVRRQTVRARLGRMIGHGLISWNGDKDAPLTAGKFTITERGEKALADAKRR